MRINTNLTAMNTYTQYTKNQTKISGAVAKLSSGYAINSAADNAAGLAISEKMRAQIRGLDKASANAQDAISLVQTAEGALDSSTQILQRMRELAVQSSSDTNENAIDRSALQDEFAQLQSELDDIAKNTTFNKKNLLDGSLATETKNLGTTSLANSGMTVSLGKAATGSYNFSVTTKLESAAVTGVEPTSVELVTDGAATYFSGTNSVALGTNVAASDLLNGNYTLSATYADPTNDNGDGQITVKATGDNGQKFEAKVSVADLEALKTGTTLTLRFNANADDAFNITLGLNSTIPTASESNYDTLASNISKLSVSVSGGVTAKDAEYGVYANLTGAESVKLEAGMNSVTFDNGVKVNFDTLTASAVDTSNDATATAAGTVVTNPSAASVLASVGGSEAHISAATFDLTAGNGIIASGAYTITDGGTGALTLTDAAGNTFTAGAQVTNATAPGANYNEQYTFTSTADSSVTFNAQLNLTAQAGVGNDIVAGATLRFTTPLTGSAAYNSTNMTNGTATFSNFQFTDDSVITNGSLTIASTYSAGTGTTTFTATRATGETYTATVTDTAMAVGTNDASRTNTLNFTNASGFAGFSVNLNTTTTGAGLLSFADNTHLTTTVADAGHNYTKIFGAGTDANLAVSTASSFSVESTANAGLTFQVGANEGDTMVINVEKMDANYLGVSSASVATRTAAAAAIKTVDSALNQVSAQRATLGAVQNRLEYKIDNLSTSSANLTSAESQIRNVDMAKEMTEFTNANILSQAATAMLAQANSLPQSVLSLIKG